MYNLSRELLLKKNYFNQYCKVNLIFLIDIIQFN